MYAIIATGGKQYKVAEGDIINVEKLGAEAGETVTFENVLAVSNDGLKVGADVAGATVTASVVKNAKARKVIVYKYKRKTGYHKKNGHRQQYTQVKIEKINAEEGYDIICAAVSVLVVNAVNSIETFTDDKFAAREDHGIVELILEGSVSDKTTLLLDSMILGLRDIQTQYGNEFIRLKIEEV